jgi:predicted RNA-binding Zn ribbon-like protein
MSELPSWYPDPKEQKPAPASLLRVQAFVNTLDPDTEVDLLDAESASGWLADAGLVDPGVPVTEADLELARGVRESLRCMLDPDGDGADGHGERLEPLRTLTAAHLARLAIGDDGVVALESADRGSLGCGLFDLLLIVRQAQEDGTWSRLKLCGNPECAWAFYDRSRNQQGNWCDMAVCGNRLKNREFRARRR